MTAPAFFAELAVVENLVDGGPVPVDHSNFATYAVDETGTVWIRKCEPNLGHEELLAEALAWLIGLELGVPIPRSAVHTDSHGARSWLSELVVGVAHWDPQLINGIENPEGMGAMMALDAIILNPDRHQGNILLQSVGSKGRWHLWAIDHDQALLAYAENCQKDRDTITDPRNLARGIPFDLIASHAMQTADIAAKIAKSALEAGVRGACMFARESDNETISNCVIHRCSQAQTLVAGYLERARKMQ